MSCGEALVDLVPEPRPGGGPFNVAVGAARLGVPTAFVGRISTDGHGDRLVAHLEAAGVDLTLTERGPEPTALAVVEHTPAPVFRFEGEGTADTCLSAADLTRLGPGPHIVHGGTLGLFRGRTATVLADLAERHEGIVSVDPNARPAVIADRSTWDRFHDRWLARCDLYKGSDADFAWIWPGEPPDRVARRLVLDGRRVVIVTHGPHGAATYCAAGQASVDAPAVDVVDSVGAGDAFVAAVLAELWRAEVTDRSALRALPLDTWAHITSVAAAAAAITCTRPGADPPTRVELDRWLQGSRSAS